MKRRDEIVEVMVIVVNLELVIFMVIHKGVMRSMESVKLWKL